MKAPQCNPNSEKRSKLVSERHQPAPDASGQTVPPHKGCLTPLSCCISCAGVGVLAVGGIVVVGYLMFFQSKPLPFEIPEIPAAARTSLEAKIGRLETNEGVPEITFANEELNAYLQDWVNKSIKTDIPAKARIDLKPNGTVHFRATVPGKERPVIGRRFLNIQFLGKLKVEKGELTISDIEYAKIGSVSLPKFSKDVVGPVMNIMKQFGVDIGEHNLDKALENVELLTVEDGKLRLKIKPDETAPPQKKEDDSPKK